MKVESFLKIVEEIENSCLSAECREEMITKISDLSRFIQSYDPSIEVINWMVHHISIIRHSGVNKGVIFCDHTKRSSANSNDSNANLINIKNQEGLQELWLVEISSCTSGELRSFINRIEDKSLDKIYDKIFSLDFLRSQVKIIK